MDEAIRYPYSHQDKGADGVIFRTELLEADRADRKVARYLGANFDRVKRMYDDWGFDEQISKQDLQVLFKVEKYLSGVESNLQKAEPTLSDVERTLAATMIKAAFHADIKQFARGVVSLDNDPKKANRVFKAVAGQLNGDALRVECDDTGIRFYWKDGSFDKVQQMLSFDTSGVTDRWISFQDSLIIQAFQSL